MARFRLRTLVMSSLAAVVVAGPECHAALAVRAGGKPRFTARLSSNPAIRRQQLIVDPEGILSGSVSVQYDPSLVRLVDVQDPADFRVTGGFVKILPTLGLAGARIPLAAFLESRGDEAASLGSAAADKPRPEREAGVVQVFFNRKDDVTPPAVRAAAAAAPSVIPNLPGFTTVDEDGPTGVGDTHALLFEYIGPPEFRARYTVYAAPPDTGTTPDYLIPADDPQNPITYRDLGSAFVLGPLGTVDRPPPAVPLPPAAWAGLLTLAGVAAGTAVLRHRRTGRAGS